MIKTNIKKCIFPFIAAIVGGCNHNRLQMDSVSGVTDNKSIEENGQGMQVLQLEQQNQLDDAYIIFLPGFTESSANHKGVPKAIRGSLKNYGIDVPEANCIVSKARDSVFPLMGPTVLQSLDGQANLVIQEIAKLPNRGNGKVNVFLVGYSQGALLLSPLDKKIKENKNSKVNLLGLISINGPWQGSPLLDKDLGAIKQFVDENSEPLNKLDSSIQADAIYNSMFQKQLGISMAQAAKAPGLLNMLPGDEYTQKAADYWRNQCTTHRLMVASCTDLVEPANSLFNSNFSEFVTGHPTAHGNKAKHDAMLPLPGQLVRGSSFENVSLVGISPTGDYIDAPQGSNNMKVFVVKGFHAANVVALHGGIFMQAGTSVLENPNVFGAIAAFIKNNVPSTDTAETSNMPSKSRSSDNFDLD